MSSHFNPKTISSLHDQFADQRVLMEGPKAAHNADMLANEVCMNKCAVNFANDRIGEAEGTCLRQCRARTCSQDQIPIRAQGG